MDDDYTFVIPHLLMGNENPTLDLELLQKLGIKHILSLGISVPNFDGINYKYMSVFDFIDFNLLPHLDRAFTFIDHALELKENVYVHCYAGISRSSSVVIAYLMRLNSWGYNRAFNYLKSFRPCIRPNVGFVRQLQSLEKKYASSHKTSGSCSSTKLERKM